MSKIAYPDSAEREYYRLLRAVARKLRQLTQEQMDNVKTALRRDEAESELISNSVLTNFEMSGAKIEVMAEVRRIIRSVDNTTKEISVLLIRRKFYFHSLFQLRGQLFCALH